jgi:hypothetical protein
MLHTQQFGDVPYVTDQAFLEAVVAAAQTQAMAGGVLSVIVDRHPTDLEHEMVTTAAVIEWKDRGDARPQPEKSVRIDDGPAIEQAGLFESTESDVPDLDAVDAEADEGDVVDGSLVDEVLAAREALR